jgi:ADP-ribose pyrophosphatase YjhB (NUDIX family)
MSNIKCSGALIYSIATQRFLFLFRKQSKNSNVWGLVGGTNEFLESPGKALYREIQEEIGSIEILKTFPLETFKSKDKKFNYFTYLCTVENEFIPKLNDEHSGYAWAGYNDWPQPLHQGVIKTLRSKIIKNKIETIFTILH